MNFIIFGENKGGQVTKCPKKAKFWANRNFWPMGWPEGQKIGRVTISAILYPHLEGILIPIKNKKVMLIESYVMPKNQKSWLPPLWYSMSKLGGFVLRCLQDSPNLAKSFYVLIFLIHLTLLKLNNTKKKKS